MAPWQYLEQGLAIELTIFKRAEGRVLSILIGKAFDRNHTSYFFFVAFRLQALVPVNTNNLSKT